MGKEDKYRLQVQAEFMNVVNRTFLSAPSNRFCVDPNTDDRYCILSSGRLLPHFAHWWIWLCHYDRGAGTQPRSGQMVARFTF
jgi:hypothetical protein